MNREITFEQWQKEGIEKFGEDQMKWAFVCPSCDYVATVQDWKNAGAKEDEVGFSCVGRHLDAGDEHTFRRDGGPCNYAGDGLFKLNPIRVVFPDGKKVDVFEFA